MWPLVKYTNYFEIGSTVTYLSRKPDSFEVHVFVFNTVLLHHYTTYNNDYT